jgi:hypothetical protein
VGWVIIVLIFISYCCIPGVRALVAAGCWVVEAYCAAMLALFYLYGYDDNLWNVVIVAGIAAIPIIIHRALSAYERPRPGLYVGDGQQQIVRHGRRAARY